MSYKINTITTNDIPNKLREILKPPKTLYVRGSLPDPSRLHIAIVGTRKATPYGIEVSRRLASLLAGRGAVIVSGLTRGIDATGHIAALDAGGSTIAVVPGGVGEVYPRHHQQLADRIASTSDCAIISESESNAHIMKHTFLERNRLVAGLCDMVIVTQAARRSGTMNTVMHALEQGRDVAALPGDITNPLSSGCNAMIAQGAQIIHDLEQFVDDLLPLQQPNTQHSLFAQLTDIEQQVVDGLRRGMRDGNILMAHCNMDASLFSQTLTMLEIRGVIKPLGANNWTLG